MAMKRATPRTIDNYIATFSPEVRAILKRIRATIRRAAPAAEEVISYRMPAFKMNRMLVYFAAFKNHIGLFPPVTGDEKLLKAVARYAGAKGNLRFPLDQPIPYGLITRITKVKVKQDAANAKKTSGPRRSKGQGASGGKSKLTKYVRHHKNGSVWAKGQTRNGKFAGYWEFFRKDGTIMRSGSFDHGEQVGAWTTYDNNGRVFKVTNMKRPAN